MKTFKQFIAEARGMFDDSHFGDTLISPDDDKYIIGQVGVIDDWDSFQQNRRIIKTNKKTVPKYYIETEDSNGNTVYFVDSAMGASPGAFGKGWSWATTKKTKRLSFKPQNFKGMTDKWLSIDDIVKILSGTEYSRFFLSSIDNVTKGTQIEGYSELSDNKGTINKDFGEILGPIWYLAQRNALKTGKIYLPAAGNEPLIDSIIKIRKDEVKISSKAGKGGTNTVKGKDINIIIDTLPRDEQKRIKSKYKDELAILNIITKSTGMSGPVEVFKHLNRGLARKHSKMLKSMPKIEGKNAKDISIPDDEPLLKDLLALVSVGKVQGNIATYGGLYFLIKKYVEETSKNMNFRDLFNDVTTGRVVYIVTKSINDKGAVFTESSEDQLAKRVYIRTKASINRAPNADKMGLQPEF